LATDSFPEFILALELKNADRRQPQERGGHIFDQLAISESLRKVSAFSPKLAKGEIASLSGAGDDPRYFQISLPVQPGKVGVQALACWVGRGTR
jgi:hypothetical protein